MSVAVGWDKVMFENWNRYYDPSIGRYLAPEPMLRDPQYVKEVAYRGMGVPTYSYAINNPLHFVDPNGLDVLVIVNGSVLTNPFGHAAIAVTGHGVFSFGTGTPLGSNLSSYIQSQIYRRSSFMYFVKTTPQQDEAAYRQLMSYGKQPLGITSNNCSNRTNEALDAAGLGKDWFPDNVPSYLSYRSLLNGGSVIPVWEGSNFDFGSYPNLQQFQVTP